MTPSKCKYVIFSNDKKRAKEEKLKISLNEVELEKNDSITFLGIIFDSYLSFGENIKKIQEKCCSRMKLIKILCQNRWHLNLTTKLALYKSLIRSIIDYSLFKWPIISIANKMKLQAIQNSALRIIFRKDRTYPLGDLHSLSGLETLTERHKTIMSRYFTKCTETKNPLISELVTGRKPIAAKPLGSEDHSSTKQNSILELIDHIFKPP